MRSLAKTGTYGVMHMAVAIVVAYAISGSFVIAMGIGLVEPVVQTAFYHIHEKLWASSSRDSIAGSRTFAAEA